MWRIVALTAVLHVLGGVSSKPLGSQQDPFLTPQGVTFEELVKQLRKVNDDELFRQRQTHRRLNLENDYDLDYPVLSPEKRSLSMLARWEFLSNIGKHQLPVREASRWRTPDGITAETRARSSGQPLRWG